MRGRLLARLSPAARRALIRIAAALRASRSAAYQARGPRSMELVLYRGTGTAERLRVRGRVLAD